MLLTESAINGARMSRIFDLVYNYEPHIQLLPTLITA